MPTIEFFGYDTEVRAALEEIIRERLCAEPFRMDCVFVETRPSFVRDWERNSRPFVRVSTRSEERADRFRALLADLCDLEIVPIDFQAATPPG